MVSVQTSGTWRFIIVAPDNVQGHKTSRITWGTPDTEVGAAGLRFAGTTAEAPLDGREFTLGTVTVDNAGREKGSGRIHLGLEAHLQVADGPAQTFAIIVAYNIVNDTGQDNADTFQVNPYAPTTETVTIDGVPYALVLTGFPTGRDEPHADAVPAAEGRSATAELRAMLVRTDQLDIAIRAVRHQGSGLTQADEYIEIVNRSAVQTPVDGWVVNAGFLGQDFTFPEGTGALAPGRPVRIYTNQLHPAWGGHSFNSPIAIWNDLGDTAEIRNKKGTVVARYAYGTAAR